MGIELRLPNISGSDREQLVQIRSYLYQIIPQLQFAINDIDTTRASGASGQVTPKVISSPSVPTIGTEATFDKLKPLIIKSAEIVEAYYEEINKKLEGFYVAESDFGVFAEKTTQDIEATSSYVNQSFEDVQIIISDNISGVNNQIKDLNTDIGDVNEAIKGLNATVIEATAHIKSGILYYDNEVPVYGLEIGQRKTVDGVEVFDKFARFTSDRLSFYDQNGTEVAYISDQKLFISNVEITSTYKVGGFVDTVTAGGGVVTKWVGGEG